MMGNRDSGGVCAPQLYYNDGKFWLIYTDVKVVNGQWKDCHNYLTTSDTIDGKWSDPVHLNSSGFDPSLFHEEKERRIYLIFFWTTGLNNKIFTGMFFQDIVKNGNN